MNKSVSVTQLDILRSHMSFTLPLGYDNRRTDELMQTLKKNGYTYFQLGESSRDKRVYGEGITVEGKELEQYFLPHLGHKLFPAAITENGFHRFTTTIVERFEYNVGNTSLPFIIQSVDIVLAPFGIAFLTIRVQLDNVEAELSDVLGFLHHFRTVEPKLTEEKGMVISSPNNGNHLTVHNLLFERLFPFLKKFMLQNEKLNGYFGSLPYYEDERMYASAFLFSREGSLITEDQLYRMGALDGRLPNGEKFISANNPDYIRRSLDQSLHDRWAPNMYTVITEHAFITVTNSPPEDMSRQLSQFMGTHYYNFLLHYFYKIMLLRVSFEYSEIVWKKDDEYVKSLIKFITLFSSWYYFQEISTRSEGKEISRMFQRVFNIDDLFNDVSKTLQELYKSQENNASDRMNMLLFFLTIFTVISGIYGMNLVIQDWESPSGWKAISSYTVFEWISLVTALSGIGLSVYLVFTTFGKVLKNKLREKKSNSRL
ncbi:hypothetical protein [Sporosarcina sp. JAI121]|uniref:hypothetical protein n=1 Tax=Sporosarcina sp. JAI121 TaxID=2723064 RepID=UPI0015CA836D|nr:hypothetical protein [Sporosarcina sp. JAI121]NYF24075.1 hypothetical protein [Sporosarcina sp. JAI121]